MKPKKNPKADLNRQWVLFLQIGLIIVLFLSLQVLNWKSDVVSYKEANSVSIQNIEEEQPPITLVKKVLPPPIKTELPPEIAPEEPEITKQKPEVFEPDLTDIYEPEDIVEAPKTDEPIEPTDFVLIEDVPVYPGCEVLKNNEARKSCMSQKIANFVNQEFNTQLGVKLGLTGMNLVVVQFVINAQGTVEEIKTRASHPELEEEARRVISKLPQMEPGKQRGKPVPVRYTIPIHFKIEN